MENKVKTSAGQETASQTVARINATREAAKAGDLASESKTNPVIAALTERLTQQGKGISSSSSSNIQTSINEAIAGIQRSGDLTSSSLQSERRREVEFAQDRAGARLTSAQESRTGFATQTVGLRELTETTEKSLRDLDQRYQEAIMNNDASTAKSVAGLQMEKLKFQQQQEQNYYQNLFSAAGLELQANAQQQSKEQFSANYDLQKTKLSLEEDMFLQSKESEIASLASQFGIIIEEGDTLSDIVGKVSPIQSRFLSLKQQNLVGEINARNEKSQSDKALANMQGTVADYIAQGLSPSQAAMQAVADLTAIGLRPTTNDLNSAVEFANKAKEEYDTISEQNSLDQSSYWELVGAGISETWVGKTQDSVADWLSGLSLEPIKSSFRERQEIINRGN